MKILKHYLPEIKRYWWLLAIMIFGLIGTVIIDLIMPFILRTFANLLTKSPLENPDIFDELIHNWWIIVVLYAGMWILHRIKGFANLTFQVNAIRDLECRAFNMLHTQSMRFFKETFTGSILKRVGRFTVAFESLTDIIYFNFAHQILKISAIMFIFFKEQPIFGLIFCGWALIFIGGSFVFAFWRMKYDIIAAEADSVVGGVMADSISNYSTVKTYSREEEEAGRFYDVSEDRAKKWKFTWKLSELNDAFQATLMIGFEIILFYCIVLWWEKGAFTVGDFVFFQAYVLVLFHTLWDFSRHVRRAFQNIADAREMVEIFERDREILDSKDAKDIKMKDGTIEFKDIEFAFEEEEKNLFAKFSLKIPGGQRVALVGPSGSGKSTMVNLLFRFYDPQKGSILIDGQDIAQVTQKSLRRNISLVPQNPELFHRTLSENISYGKPDATQKEIENASKIAHADDFIDKTQEKYKTLVGERGVKLSGGERQRIAIARAFLENAPILVLDEATSSLDSITEKKIQDAIFTLMENRTSIVIAHRLSTILHMDRIIVLKNGEIVEDGTHKELLNNQGLYYEMWSHQAGGFIGEE